MARKQYYKLIQRRVAFLRKDGGKMIRLGSQPPTINELGDVFEHVYTGIESERNSAIKYAFKVCKLDLDNPFHWADLLRALCELSFTREQTQNQTRDKNFFAQLKKNRIAVSRKYPSLSQLDQAKKLRSEFPKEYGHLKDVSIRRLFSQKAKRPKSPKRLISFKNRA